MKRFLSLFLVLVLFTAMLPADALAVEDTFSMTKKEVLAIKKRCGYETSKYRKGMSFSASMSGYQMYSFLSEFKEGEAANVTSRYASLNRLLDETPAIRNRPEMEGFDALSAQIDTLNSEVGYFIYQFDEQIRAITGSIDRLNDPSTEQSEKPALYRRLQKADIKLHAIMDEVSQIQSGKNSFTKRASTLNAQLNAYSASHADLMQRLSTASDSPRLLQSGDFHFVVIDQNQIGFVIYDENRQVLPDATVKVVSGDKTCTVTSDQYGIALFTSGYFPLDDRHRLTAKVYITASGKREYESHALHLTGGEGVNVYLEADDGEPYIQYMDFRGIDILHETESVYTTSENDAAQPFKVGIHTKAGKQSTFQFMYTEADTRTTKTVERSVSGTADKVVTLDLSNKWCAMLEPNMAATACLSNGGSTPVEVHDHGIAVKKAAVKVPLPNIPMSQAYLPGTQLTLNLPFNLKGLKNLQVGFNFPTEIKDKWPVSVIITPEGYFSLGISVTESKEFTDKASGSGWKTKNSVDAFKDMEALIETRETLTSLAQRGIQKRREANTNFLDMNKVKFDFTFAAMLTGSVNPDKTEPLYNGALDLLVTVAGTGSVSFSEPFMVGFIPTYVGFDFSVGLMVGVNFGFKFKTTNLSAIRFQEWSDFEFDKEKLEIIVSPMASIAFYGGVGVKSVLGFYIRAYSNFAIALHIRPAASNYKFIAKTSANIGVELVVELLFVRIKATFLDKTWSVSDPDVAASPLSAKSEDESTGIGEAVEEKPESFVRAQLTEVPSDIKMPAGAYVFNWAEDEENGYSSFLGVYKTRKTINSVERDWLDIAMIFDKLEPGQVVGKNDMYTEVNGQRIFSYDTTNFLYGEETTFGSVIWGGNIPDDAYLVDFAADCTDEVCPDGTPYKVVAVVAVYAQHRNDDADGNPTNCKGELYYIFMTENKYMRFYIGEMIDFCQGLPEPYMDESFVMKYRPVCESECPKDLNITFRYSKGNRTVLRADAYYCTVSWIKSKGIQFCGQDIYVRSGWGQIEDEHSWALPIQYVDIEGFYLPNVDNETQVYVFQADKYNYDLTCLRHVTSDGGRMLTKLQYNKSKNEWKMSVDSLECYEDIVHVEVDDRMNSKVVLLKRKDETGKCDVVIQSFERNYKTSQEKYPAVALTPILLDAKLSPAELSVVNFGATRALYYIDQTFTNVEETGSTFGLKGVYMADGSDGLPYISKPFYLAKFSVDDVPMGANIVSCKLFKNPDGFMNGIAEINMPSGNGENVPGTYLVDFRETIQVDLRSTAIENPLLKAGEVGNLLFNVMNTGNVPVSKFSMDAYALDSKGTRRNLAKINVACVDPVMSVVSTVSSDNLLTTAGRSSAAVSECDYPLGDDYRTLITSVNGSTSAYATNVLMPGETRCYRATFRVPEDFDPGAYDTYLKLTSISTVSTRTADGRLDSTSAWIPTLFNMDTSAGKKAMKPAGVNETAKTLRLSSGLMTVTAEVIEGSEPSGMLTGAGSISDGSPVNLVVEGLANADGEEGPTMLSAYADKSVARSIDLDLQYADLSIRARRIDAAGEEQAHIVLQNDAATSVSDLTLKAELDGVETFTYPLGSDFSLDGTSVCSMDIPLDTLTGGKKGESLILSISCATGDIDAFNNRTELLLQQTFVIAGQPKDQFVYETQTASFDILTRGGEAPLAYQWQWSDSRNGEWKNIENENDRRLIVQNAALAQNGLYVRCLVKDNTGTVLKSEPALLTVAALPATGDSDNPALYAAVLLLCVGALFLLLRRRKLRQ